MYSKILLILSGNVGTAFLTLLRNLVLAKLMTVEDYGIAATFAVVMAMVEVVTAFGLQQLIIQSKKDDADWQAALQGFQILRALVPAALLVIFAPQIAGFLGVPEIAWAYQVLAIAPLMNGIVHLDIYRLNRQMVYLPLIAAQTGPAFLSLLLIWPLWLWLGDWRVMLVAVVLQWVVMAIISLVVAERRYRLRLERSAILSAVQFGWPLMLNNVLLFAVMNGEKMVVARELGMASLAIFAMGFTLTLTPTMVLARSFQSFFLPQLSAVQDDDARFQPLGHAIVEANFFNGIFMVFGIVLVGGPFVALVLGEKYADLIPLLTWLAVLQALRVFKAGGAVVGIARTKTGNAMISNSFRVLSLPLSWWVAISTGDLLIVILIASLGEALGVVTSLILARSRAGLKLAPLQPMFAAVAVFLGLVMLGASLPDLALNLGLPGWSGLVPITLSFLLCLWTMRASQGYLKSRTLARREA